VLFVKKRRTDMGRKSTVQRAVEQREIHERETADEVVILDECVQLIGLLSARRLVDGRLLEQLYRQYEHQQKTGSRPESNVM